MNWTSLLIADDSFGSAGWLCFVVVTGLSIAVVRAVLQAKERARMSPEERTTEEWGRINPALICPHCQTKGQVRTKGITQKKGISGAKATGALLTAGVSVLATGLSRKEDATQSHCYACGSKWVF
jgi:hypothetical protein